MKIEKADYARDLGWISTGEAARLLSVTADTVLKWVKQGKLAARRTVGGHHRIESGAIERLRRVRDLTDAQDDRRRPALNCWEYFSDGGEIKTECRECAVYRVRAERCFELRRLDSTLPCQRLFCDTSCEDCPYYLHAHQAPVRVLAVSKDESLGATLELLLPGRAVVRVAQSVYAASSEIGTMRPSVVLIDSDLPADVVASLAEAVSADTRVPWARLFMIGTDSAAGAGLPTLSRSHLDQELMSCL